MIKTNNVDQYNDLFAQAKESFNNLDELRSQREALYLEINSLDMKIHEELINSEYLKHVINLMIREDLDPVQAVLTVDKNTVYDKHRDHDEGYPKAYPSASYSPPPKSLHTKRASIRKVRK